MESKKPRISIVVSMGAGRSNNHVIGLKNGLLWPIPDDLKRFRSITMGHPVIMGRKTFESILKILGKPLPGRTNIVITRDTDFKHEGAVVVHSLEDGIQKASEIDQDEIFIGGGAQIYEQALPHVDRLYLTLVKSDEEGDTYFPSFEKEFTKVISSEDREHEGLKYKWVTLEK